MKKTLALFLAVLLLTLSAACETDDTENSDGLSPAPDDASQAIAGESPDPSPSSPSPATSGSAELRVKTDYSKLTPFESPSEIVSFFYGETPEYLVASGDYGTLMPYIGKVMYSNSVWEAGRSDQAGILYGLATLDGEIVCEPSYTNVTPLYLYDYSNNSSSQLPIYQLMINDESMSVFAAAMDGSWVTERAYSWFQTRINGFCGIRTNPDYDYTQDGSSYYEGVDFFDYDGNLIYRSENIAQELGIDESYIVSLADADLLSDLFPLQVAPGETWFFDSGFNRLIGPCYYASVFSGGLAAASLDGESYGYIDREGNWVIEPGFSIAESFDDNGHAFVRQDNIPMIIDRDGEILFSLKTSSSGYVYRTDFGYAVDIWGEERSCRFFDNNMNEIHTDLSEQGYSYSGNGLFSLATDDGAHITDGEKTLFVEDCTYIYDSLTSDEGRVLFIAELVSGSTWSYRLMDMDGNILSLAGSSNIYTLADSLTEEIYLANWTRVTNSRSRCSILDVYGNTYISDIDGFPHAHVYDGRFIVTDGYYSGIIDKNGEWVLRLSLLNSIPD